LHLLERAAAAAKTLVVIGISLMTMLPVSLGSFPL
jgi:hypothetical protein